ncbi:hypothetical protein UMM65_08175 [Aureibaculum sp. 2210JD6-5]|uniref:hypothetical protein n=1 Tax=Aureibaculum sp. 2210JD6-5 TaxID=3103957 RepID=UPI002AADE5D0|nr:hypothetical protein [Aureibaculum sp. 2210JD6-5]MDY7395216.1 hypothetical protein [Aureibaculum sp. 2210JD6-5]
MMNLEIHHKGQSDYLDKVKNQVDKKIETIKNSKLLKATTKKIRIKAIKRAFIREKKESHYNNY